MTKNILARDSPLFQLFASISEFDQKRYNQLVNRIAQKAQIINPKTYTTLYANGQKISAYYFLIKGVILLSRMPSFQEIDNRGDEKSQTLRISEPGIIGEYYFSPNRVRVNTAIVEENTQILKIDVEKFHQILEGYIKYKLTIQEYLSNQLKISLFSINPELFISKNFILYEEIKGPLLAIIVKGQCKVSARKKQKQCSHSDEGSFKLPQLLKLKIPLQEILILGNNQWIGVENLFESQIQFKYSVISSKLELIKIPLMFAIDNLPAFKNGLLEKIHKERCYRLESSQLNPKEGISLQNSKVKKNRQMKAFNILNSLDPNLSPQFLRQKYRLGYSNVRYDLNEKSNRKSLGRVEFSCPKVKGQIVRDKKQRKTDIKSQNRDWSTYLKYQIYQKNKEKLRGIL